MRASTNSRGFGLQFLDLYDLDHPAWGDRLATRRYPPIPSAFQSNPREYELPTVALSTQRYVQYLGTCGDSRHFTLTDVHELLDGIVDRGVGVKLRPGPRRIPRVSVTSPTPNATRQATYEKIRTSYTNDRHGYAILAFYYSIHVGPHMPLLQEVQGFLNWCIRDDIGIIWLWVEYNQYHKRWLLQQTLSFRHLIKWLRAHISEFRSVMTAPEDEAYLQAQVFNAFQKFLPQHGINNIRYQFMNTQPSSMRLYPAGYDFPCVDHQEFTAQEVQFIQKHCPQHWYESSRAAASRISSGLEGIVSIPTC